LPALSRWAQGTESAKESNTEIYHAGRGFSTAIVEEACQQFGASFERFCLTAGTPTLAGMMEADAARPCGVRYGRGDGKDGDRCGRTKGKLASTGQSGAGATARADPMTAARSRCRIGKRRYVDQHQVHRPSARPILCHRRLASTAAPHRVYACTWLGMVYLDARDRPSDGEDR
jgi:hypothetical protein